MYTCVDLCVCVCVFPCVIVFVWRMCHVCVWEKEQRLHLVRAAECASMKHFCHSRVPFWSTSEVEWGQEQSGEGSHLRRPLTQGASNWSQSGLVVPLSAETTRAFIWCVMTPLRCLRLHSSAIQYSAITCGTKRVKTQADFGDKLPRIRGLYPGSSWREAGRAEAKVTS